MDFDVLCRELEQKNISFRKDEPLGKHTSFRIGGPAAVMAFPKSAEEAVFIMQKYCDEAVLLGHGTNVLAADEPIEKLVVKTYNGLGRIRLLEDNIIEAESGAALSSIAVFALQHDLSGFEFAHGIPGSFGGAIYMNAGAYGGEMKDVVVESTCFENGSIKTRTEHDFSYRHSIYSDNNALILRGKIKLEPGDPEEIAGKMKDLAERRKASQPLELPSAGSTFKRPKTGYAAEMIDKAGLKGMRVGDAEVSVKHAGFIVNRGNATCADVLALVEAVQKRVMEVFGVELEPEIRLIK